MEGFAMRWPEADVRAVALLGEAGASCVWLPWEAPGDRRAFLAACRAAGLRVIAELAAGETARLSEARAAGFQGAAFAWEGDQEGLQRIEAQQQGFQTYVLLDAARIGLRTHTAHAVLRAGAWPGAQRPEPGQASATQRAWVHSNLHLLAWLRAVFPDRTALLSYRPDEDGDAATGQRTPYWSAELALAEAAVAGGSAILTLPESLRRSLPAAQGMAREAWESLVQASRFLREQGEAFRAPLGLRVAALAGPLEESAEVLKLLFRFNVSPAIVPVTRPGPLAGYRVVLAIGLREDSQAARAALEFARSGGTVLAIPASANERPWWRAAGLRKVKADDGRDICFLGKGTLIVYQSAAGDPGEIAEDVLDALGWTRRDLRIWGTDTVIGLLRRRPGGGISVDLLNYGGRGGEFLIRLEGKFAAAELRQPGEGPRPLRAAVRGSGTEIEMPRIRRVARLLLA
ncbi:MAG: hypothetical protein RMI94_11195 [Bryobacterales bacterium]|nr:hypothetical protein [Bryobacteraceae bacterium]MDW8131106.1 hypothetical protein [Bryobacterales bacterium]